MTVIESKIKKDSKSFANNAAAMQAHIDDLRAKLKNIEAGGPDTAKEKHTARGKLLPRDRIKSLIDPETDFLEFSQLAAYNVYGEDVPAAGIITGICKVSGID